MAGTPQGEQNMTKKKKQKTEQATTITVTHTLTPQEIKQAFIKAMEERDENQDLVSKLVFVCDMHLSSGRPFDELSILKSMAQFDVSDSIPEIQRLLRLYILKLSELNKIAVVHGCMDNEIFVPQ
jgi:hypothetical protein